MNSHCALTFVYFVKNGLKTLCSDITLVKVKGKVLKVILLAVHVTVSEERY